MSSAPFGLVYPVGSTSQTLTVFFRLRVNEGVGASVLTCTSHGLTDLAIVFPSGISTPGATITSLKDVIVLAVMNSALPAWYSCASGTLESNLRSALDLKAWPNASHSMTVLFDGQFGPVLVA